MRQDLNEKKADYKAEDYSALREHLLKILANWEEQIFSSNEEE